MATSVDLERARGVVPMGKVFRTPETSPCRIMHLAGCGAYLGSAGTNPGTPVVPPMSVCSGCDARLALRPVPRGWV